MDKTLYVLAQAKRGGDSNLRFRENMVRQMSEELTIILKSAATLVAVIVCLRIVKSIFTETE